MSKPLRFHWSLSQAGNQFRRAGALEKMSGLPDLDAQLELCRRAEESGIESMLMAIGFTRPDPLLLTIALGMETTKIKFMAACRPALISPTAFVQQVNTLSAVLNGRILINMVSGQRPEELRYYGDYLPHDERYDRMGEFLSICNAFWQGHDEVNFSGKYYQIAQGRLNTPFVSTEETAPQIYLGGHSEKANELAIQHASCQWRIADTPENLHSQIKPVLEQGKEVGLLVSLIVRPTREEAVQAAYALIDKFDEKTKTVHQQFAKTSDSVGFKVTFKLAENNESGWLTPYLWSGAVLYLGAPSMALVGSTEEIVAAIMAYKNMGISQFLFMGWPDIDEMTFFGREVLPVIREAEQRTEDSLGE